MKKYSYILAILFGIFLSACTSSKPFYTLNSPGKLSDSTGLVSMGKLMELYPNDDGVFLSYRNILEVTATKNFIGGEFSHERRRYVERSYMILNPTNEALSTFIFREGTDKLLMVSLKITHPDGTNERVGMSLLKKEKDANGSMVYKYAYPNVQKGTVVQEHFSYLKNDMQSAIFRDLVESEFVFTSEFPILDYTFCFSYPSWWKVAYKRQNIPASSVSTQVDEKKDQINTTFRLNSIPAWVNEPYSPYRREMVPSLKIKVIECGLYIDAGNFASPKDWESVSDFYKEYAVNENFLFNLFLSNSVKGMTAKANSPREKAKAILTHIRNTITVESGNQWKDFSDVLNSKKGNPMNITGLTQSLLREAGIRSDFIMIYDRSNGSYDDSYINFFEFEVPALRVFVESDTLYSIPYMKQFPYLFLPDNLSDQPALIVRKKENSFSAKAPTRAAAIATKETKGKTEELMIRIPENEIIQNEILQKSTLTINEEGSVKVSESFRFSGSPAVEFRGEIEDLKKYEVNQKILEKFSIRTENTSNIVPKITNLTEADSSLIVEFEYSIENLTTITPEEVLVQLDELISPISIKRFSLDNEKRVLPISITYPFSYRREINISVPEGWTLQNKIENASVSNEFGELNLNGLATEKAQSLQYNLIIRKSNQPSEKYPDLKKLLSPDERFHPGTFIYSNSL